MLENVTEKLIASPLGQELGEAACRDIIACGKERSWGRGALLFQEHDPAKGFYLLIRGRVKLVRYTDEGREILLHPVEPYRFFAEAAPFLGAFPATAVAIEDTVALFLPQETVQELMRRHTSFMNTVFDTMAVWLKRMVDKVDQLTLNDATARVARYLQNLGAENGDETASARPIIELPIKKGDLATMLNMNQATLSRSFRKLQDEEAIRVEGKRIVVLSPEKLARFALPPLE